MHHVHHTEAIILGSRNYGEAGKYYYLLTRDLGMLYASAQGVRKMSSKLRYILQDFSYVKIDLVQGRDMWRVTSASKTNMLEDVSTRREAHVVCAHISRLLRRLLAGVEPNQELFHDILNGLSVLEKSSVEHMANVEAIMVLRILSNLGYIGEGESWKGIIKSPFGDELVYEASKERQNILKEINRALKETQM